MFDRFHADYFHDLRKIASTYKTTMSSHVQFTKNDNLPISDETFKFFLAMLVCKFSETISKNLVFESCEVTNWHQELDQCDGDIDVLLQKKFQEHNGENTFNEDKVKFFSKDDRQYEKLLDLARNGVDFEVDPDFVPNTSVEPLLNLQRKLQNIYTFHIDKLVSKKWALIFDLKRLKENQKESWTYFLFISLRNPPVMDYPSTRSPTIRKVVYAST